MAGIEAVAKLAGVSIATVSRALSGKGNVSERARTKVQEAAAQLGYIASSSAYTLATGRNRNIGVVVPVIDRWFFSTILQAVETELIEHGYDVTLYNLSGGEKQRRRIFNEFLRRQRVDGVLTVAVQPSPEELEQLTKVGKPIVGAGGRIPGARSLVMNDYSAGKLAVEHLISLGHKKIAIIGAEPQADAEFHQPAERYRGYLAALTEHGLEHHDYWRFECEFTIEAGYNATKQLFGDPLKAPTAIFCYADELAYGAMMAVRDLGMRVPEDISIVGIDNHDMANFYGLTTVDQRVREQGQEIAKMMLAVLEDPDAPINVELQRDWDFELIVRGSTARPASK
ncbi:MAG: hypothetical protein RL719_967 [Actinomycetota bacterium]|jgi:DNA-binding LacI/PurR family transcriptional regulator